MEGAKRRAKVTKVKKGDRLIVEYVAGRTGAVVLKYPAGGTVRLEKAHIGVERDTPGMA